MTRSVADVFSAAYSQGVEISYAELARVLGYNAEDPLGSAQHVLDYASKMELEFSPGVEAGDFYSPRVLCRAGVSDDTLRSVEVAVDAGESTSVEYKASLFADVKRYDAVQQLHHSEEVTNSVLKTVCAFLNTRGGTLLIGVDDAGEPCPGVTLDMACKGWDLDAVLLSLVEMITGRFIDGTSVRNYVSVDSCEKDGCTIVCVRVIERTRPTFLKLLGSQDATIFVRTGPRSDRLDLPAFYDWLQASGRLNPAP